MLGLATVSENMIRMGERGRLVIPSEVRRRIGLKPGDRLILSEADGEIRLRPASASIEALRGAWGESTAGRDLADELIAERRSEAGRE
jgi:AbrB family looped-hinge helix DNA binding protein